MPRGRCAVSDKIPVSVIITTLNEESNLARCLSALERFDEIVVVDSGSADSTVRIAASFGARVEHFKWNGRYPKKRQWCLDNLHLRHDWIFFVDADEEITPALCAEVAALDWSAAGYFVKGAYVLNGRVLRYGLKNNKLCLFDRRKMEFPVVSDLDIPGMGEMEGHYQPVLKPGAPEKLGVLKQALWHYALEDKDRWRARHEGYANWHKSVVLRDGLPPDPSFVRRNLKRFFYASPARPALAFLHSYVVLGGFLDGRTGFYLAQIRFSYYKNQA
jgi:glycosyltransferase involved in cell wall biosynthesis